MCPLPPRFPGTFTHPHPPTHHTHTHTCLLEYLPSHRRALNPPHYTHIRIHIHKWAYGLVPIRSCQVIGGRSTPRIIRTCVYTSINGFMGWHLLAPVGTCWHLLAPWSCRVIGVRAAPRFIYSIYTYTCMRLQPTHYTHVRIHYTHIRIHIWAHGLGT